MPEPKKADPEAMLREWSTTPAVNPHYKGATPGDVVRALLRKRPVRHLQKVADSPGPVKTGI